jgi:Fe-S-cluster containining protein
MSEEAFNPCISCGACCSKFRVSFYWGEADDAPGGYVPTHLTEKVTPFLRAMAGTHPIPLRCVALQGEIGQSVSCSIYSHRPNPCREFSVWLEDGRPNPACTKVRAKIGLPELPAIHPAASDAERQAG